MVESGGTYYWPLTCRDGHAELSVGPPNGQQDGCRDGCVILHSKMPPVRMPLGSSNIPGPEVRFRLTPGMARELIAALRFVLDDVE